MQWETAVAWFDWVARVHFAGTLLSGVLSVIAGGSAYYEGWDWLSIILAMIGTFAGVGIIYIAFCFFWDRSDGKRQRLDKDIRPKAEPAVDWPIRDLFHYLAPHLPLRSSEGQPHRVIGTTDERWKIIGQAVLNQLSKGRLHATGVGYRNVTKRLNAAPIPQDFWPTANFTYWFLDGDGAGILDAKNTKGEEFSDIELDRNEAMTIWPKYPFPNFKKWDEYDEFELYEAACLWFDFEPTLPMPEQAVLQYQFWREQVFNGVIPVHTNSVRHAVGIGAREETAVTPHTKISRDVVVALAENDHYEPLSLYPHRRTSPRR